MLEIIRNEKQQTFKEKLESLKFCKADTTPWCIIDKQNDMVECNPLCLEHLKVSYKDYIGTNLYDWWTRDYPLTHDSLKKNNYVTSLEIQDAEGNFLIVKVKMEKFTHDTKHYTAIRAVNIKQRPQSPLENYFDQLKEINSSTNSLVDNMPLGLSIVTRSGKFLWANEVYAQKIGYELYDLLFSRNIEDITIQSLAEVNFDQEIISSSHWRYKIYKHKNGHNVSAKIKTKKTTYNGVPVFFSVVDYTHHDCELGIDKINKNSITNLLNKTVKMEINIKVLEKVALLFGMSIQEFTAIVYWCETNDMLEIEGIRKKKQYEMGF
tara:strand:+ start:4757 stop:5722 length:966 start_codon:yes stop_codon:yes gene_type:complete